MTDHHQRGDGRTADAQPGWTPSRRAVLAMGGMVGGTMATLGVGAARAETRPARPTALPEGPGTGGPLLDGSRFPIGAFWPPPPLQITNERYRELARAGITYLHTGNYGWADTQIVQHSLRIADEEGLQVLVDDPDIRWLTRNVSISDSGGDLTVTRSEAEQVLRAVINRYRPVSWWKIVDGQLLVTGGTGNGSIGIAKAGANWTDYTMSFTTRPRATGAGGYAQSGWAFRVTDNDNAYVWLLSNQTGPGNLVKAVFVNGQPTVTTVALDMAVDPDTDYKISTEVRGSTITTKINGTVVDTTTDSTFTSGGVGFRQAGNESATFDDVRVTGSDGTVLLEENFSSGLGAWQIPGGSGHASFAGIHLYDEPHVTKLADLGALAAIIRGIDPDVLPYINLLPGFDYEEAMKQTTPELLSFDRYPILSSGDDAGYCANWAAVRAAALPTDTPTWTYIQSVGFNAHAVPTKADLHWQINISLAFGCKGIQYFTWWTPDPARGEGFHDGIITVDGEPTELYDAALEVNTTWLSRVGLELLPLRSEAVQAAGHATVPDGLEAFSPDDEIASVGGGAAVLGRFSGPGADTYLLIANWSRTQRAPVDLSWGSAVAGVSTYDPRTGRYRSRGRSRLTLQHEAGRATLIRIQRH